MAEMKIRVSKKNLQAAKAEVAKDGKTFFDAMLQAKAEDASKYVRAFPAVCRLVHAVSLPDLTLIMAEAEYPLAVTDKGKPKSPNGSQRLWDIARAAENLVETAEGEEIPMPVNEEGEPFESWSDALRGVALEKLSGHIRAARGPSKTGKRKTEVERAEAWVKKIHKAITELSKGEHKPANTVAGRVNRLPGFNTWACIVAYHESPYTPMGVSFLTEDDALQAAAKAAGEVEAAAPEMQAA